jgi:hypothetical protein
VKIRGIWKVKVWFYQPDSAASQIQSKSGLKLLLLDSLVIWWPVCGGWVWQDSAGMAALLSVHPEHLGVHDR